MHEEHLKDSFQRDCLICVFEQVRRRERRQWWCLVKRPIMIEAGVGFENRISLAKLNNFICKQMNKKK